MNARKATYLVLMFQLIALLWILSSIDLLLSDQSIPGQLENASDYREFRVDYENRQFLMDGRPFRFISGSFHYFRALPETWRRKLRTMRAAGLNTVATYVEWSLHNPKDNVYNFEGMADLVKFIKLAVEEDLYVILRPGPYICAERDFGGFPYWLLNKYPGIKLRSHDADYLKEVSKWYEILLTKIKPYLYGNRGPIIMVQLENEYGFNPVISEKYKDWLRNETLKYVEDKAVLFTSDPPYIMGKGRIKNVLQALNFGKSSNNEVDSYWKMLNGPLVNAEFYPGWLTHWQEKNQRVPIEPVIQTFEKMLTDGANVNFYMFHGGTNFGFTAGANYAGPGNYSSDITSYDYDAPMDEAGCVTPKYMAIRETIAKFYPLPGITIPECPKRIKLPDLKMIPICSILEKECRNVLLSFRVWGKKAKSFEALNQNSGFVLYETDIPKSKRDPSLLFVGQLRDRAYIYVGQEFVGTMSRANAINSFPVTLGMGKRLQILVENEGRINMQIPKDFKGLLGQVKFAGKHLQNWTMTGFPFDSYAQIEKLIELNESGELFTKKPKRISVERGPVIFQAKFTLTQDQIHDTFLDPRGWGKGFVFVNGFNIGRYWPIVGPQITLYIPGELLREGVNTIVILELQLVPNNRKMKFSREPILDT